ncbi:DegT/DnrJ/EryC1/StrS family aminotransferase, partial [Candidatus Omnitrophota bacterium]
MADGVEVLIKETKKTQGCIWVPDYICNEPLEALRDSRFNLVFYPIDRDLRPKWDVLEFLAEETARPDVFVLVHYFGFTNDINGARMFCQKYQAELLEDAAHTLFPTGCIGQSDNAIIFSPRKLLSVPEGGLLVMPERFSHHLADGNRKSDKKVVIKWLAR